MVEPREFYRSDGASTVMSVSHLTDAVLPLLQMELLTTRDCLRSLTRDQLVEFGCFDGRSLEAARSAGVGYVGVDINASAVARLEQRIDRDPQLVHGARAVHGDVSVAETWRSAVTGARPLVLLPFHLLGSIPDPKATLCDIAAVPTVAVVVTVFRDDVSTARIRREYYHRCGITGLREQTGLHDGQMFAGDGGFVSETFGGRVVETLLADAGLVLHEVVENPQGRCYVAGVDTDTSRS